MSKTLKTRSPTVRAKAEGVSLPKVICRRPRRGDTHPASSQIIRGALSCMPAGYLVGLNRIELCPRGGAVGEPFGKYSPAEKAIYLYSLPMEWDCSRDSAWYIEDYRLSGADIEVDESGATVVRWPDAESRCVWFVLTILGHELGHHYREQDRFRNRRRGRRDEEIGAQLHARRITSAELARVRKLRARSD